MSTTREPIYGSLREGTIETDVSYEENIMIGSAFEKYLSAYYEEYMNGQKRIYII